MKTLKRLTSLLLVMLVLLALTGTALADNNDDVVGSITIANPQSDDATYYAYKIFDVVYDKDKTTYAYTISKDSDWFDVVANVDNDGNVTPNVNGLSFDKAAGDKGTYVVTYDAENYSAAAFADTLHEALEDSSKTYAYSAEFNEQKDGSLKANVTELGYYFVTSSVGALCNLTTTNPDVIIYDKNEEPTINKNIVKTDESRRETLTKNTNAAIGDKVEFELDSKVPSMTGYQKYYFIVTDTLSKGLTFNNDVEIKIGEKTLTAATYYEKNDTDIPEGSNAGDIKKLNDYYIKIETSDDGLTIVKIVFVNFIQYQDQTDEDIVITYSATVNEDAEIGVEGNPNDVYLTYSNDPSDESDGDPNYPYEPDKNSPVGVTPESKTRTYVTGIELTKVDSSGNRLTGAQFEITGTKLNTVIVSKDEFIAFTEGEESVTYYWLLNDGTYTNTDPSTEGIDTDEYVKNDEGTYTKYIKGSSDKPIEKTENVQYIGTVGDDGILRFEGLSAGTYRITEIKAPDGYNLLTDDIIVTIDWTAPESTSTKCTWKYNWIIPDNANENDSYTNKATVVNQLGSILPSTGGVGTTMFYVIGSILVIGAGVLLVVKKRMSHDI